MNGITFYPYGTNAAVRYAAQRLTNLGCNVSDVADGSVTHLLLPVPSFDPHGHIRGGSTLEDALSGLPESVTIIGGKLENPLFSKHKCIDLLKDPRYLAENAAITAECALQAAMNNLTVTLAGSPVLVLGWGRIGKCLAYLLRAIGADVTVAVRKESDLAMVQALGFRGENLPQLSYGLMRYRVIFNTVPAPVLSRAQTVHCRPECLLIDLASTDGIEGDDVIRARGLPGSEVPESSGNLIAKTIIRLTTGREF